MLPIATVLVPLALALVGQASRTGPGLLFVEDFEDTKLPSRGWYEGDRFMLSDEAVAGKHAVRYRFPKGELTPSDSSGVRHLFGPTEAIYLRFYLRLSPDWSWTGRPYGPHLFHSMTTRTASTTARPPAT